MASFGSIFNFYKECYLNDYKSVSADNFFGKSVENRFLLKTFEPLSERLSSYPIDSEYGKLIDEELAIHSKEKGLYAAAFFIKGQSKLLGRSIKIFAPLYLYEVVLNVQEEVYTIAIDREQPIINPAFLGYLKTVDENITLNYDDLVDALPKGIMDFENLIALQSSLQKLFPNLNIDCLEERLLNENIEIDLEELAQSRSKKYELMLLNGLSLGIMNKPKGARGVLNELTALAERQINSNLLHEIFIRPTSNAKIPVPRAINIPVALSEQQKKVFYAVDSNTITQVIGPPGTGKSFTIAALTTELISQGKSILIASKNNQAGKVIANKIENEFGLKGLVVKTASQHYKSSLISRINKVLWGVAGKKVLKTELVDQLNEIQRLNNHLIKLKQNLIKREAEEIKWGRFFYQYKAGFFEKFKAKWIAHKQVTKDSISDLKKSIDREERIKNRKIKKFIGDRYNAYLYSYLLNNRELFLNLLAAFKEESGNLIHEKFNLIDFKLVLKAMPAWICNTTDLHNILPLKEEIFDVLIIDEASQSDIASTIPLLYRAKKVVVVGDPNQLRHFSFLSRQQQQSLKRKYNLGKNILNYRENSILDLTNQFIKNQSQVIFLDEHYRSVPAIISFSNQKFYEAGLKIMTVDPSRPDNRGLVVRRVEGARDVKGFNKNEAVAILATIQSIVQDEKLLDKKTAQSIGILSPFRAQVDYLKKLIRSEFEVNAIKKHGILIGTPYHFQGEERDVMLLSFVVDAQVHPSIYTYLNKEDMFNVSITRARNNQYIFTSIDYKNLNPNYLLSQYLNSIEKNVSIASVDENEEYDHFAEAVIAVLERLKVQKIIKYYAVGGVEIDLVVVKNDKTFCIDLIGYPGTFEPLFAVEKMQLLDRMGFNIFFLPYSNWYLDRKKCEVLLKKWLKDV